MTVAEPLILTTKQMEQKRNCGLLVRNIAWIRAAEARGRPYSLKSSSGKNYLCLSVLGEAYDCRSFSKALSAHNEAVFLNHTSSVETDSASSGVFAEINCVLVV